MKMNELFNEADVGYAQAVLAQYPSLELHGSNGRWCGRFVRKTS